MKASNPIDLAFFGILIGFVLLLCIEILKLIQPYYSFFGASICVLGISILYFIYKNGGIQFLRSEMNSRDVSDKIKEFSNYPIVHTAMSYIENNKNSLFYGSFIGIFVCVLIALIFNIHIFLTVVSVLFFLIFFIVKIFGFELSYHLEKNTLHSANAIRFFLLTFGIFIIILSFIFQIYQVAQEQILTWYYIFGGMYMLGGGVLFFSWNINIKRFFNVYNSLSFIFLSTLIIFLGYQNGFLNLSQNQVVEVPQENEVVEILPAMQPGIITQDIISEEVAIEQNIIEENINNEIIFETERVANIYTLPEGLQLGSAGSGVSDLQEVLGKLQYYTGEVNGEFTEETRQSLIQTLRSECSWPESTRGIFGPAAKNCIDNLEINIAVN